MSKVRAVLAVGVSLVLFSEASSAAASSVTAGTINSMTVQVYSPGGQYFFSTTGTRTATPSCATQPRWVIDTSTSAGQSQVAALLSAYTMNKKVSVTGTGTCSVWADTETVLVLYIID